MEDIFSLTQSASMDKALIRNYSLSEELLINNAARGAFNLCLDNIKNKNVLFLVGKGNNGSDALEMARLSLNIAKSVSVLLLYPDGNQENMRRRGLLPSSCFVSDYLSSDTVIDGIFGFSFHGNLEGRIIDLFSTINDSGAYTIALDVPSGFKFNAKKTITFMCKKAELYYPENRGVCGEICSFNPGFPKDEIKGGIGELLDFSDYSTTPFTSTDYKNSRGHLLVCGGSPRYPGAPILSSLAAFHSGCGLVTLLSDSIVLDKVLSSYPSIMGIGQDRLNEVKASSALIGPGWDKGDRKLLEKIKEKEISLVLDADAIKLIQKGDFFNGRAIITPHLGEFRTLKKNLNIEEDDFLASIKHVSYMLDAVLVVKSSVVWIIYKDNVYVVDGSNPTLGVAGSGDVLSGIIGSFLAFKMDVVLSAINGVLLHQMCGRKLRDELGFYSAEDIIKTVGKLR